MAESSKYNWTIQLDTKSIAEKDISCDSEQQQQIHHRVDPHQQLTADSGWVQQLHTSETHM